MEPPIEQRSPAQLAAASALQLPISAVALSAGVPAVLVTSPNGVDIL